MIFSLGDRRPLIHSSCFIAPSANVIGEVILEEGASVWFQAVLRADDESIHVGPGTNIQDGVIIHVDPGKPCRIGRSCVVGHQAVLHGCTIEDNVLIGIGATVLNGAHIHSGCLVGAGALVSENKVLESGGLYLGSPARRVRDLSEAEKENIINNTLRYQQRAIRYQEQLHSEPR